MQALLTFYNPTTGKEYSGGNIQTLQDVADTTGWTSGQFATYRQWKEYGRIVKKGQKACAYLTYYGKDAIKQEDGTTKERGFAKSFCVFSLEQTEKAEGQETTETTETTEPQENKPEHGVQYSLAALSQTGSWEQSRVRYHLSEKDKQKLREKVEQLTEKAKQCFTPRLENTAKRICQAMGKRLEGARLERQASIISGVLACDVLPSAIQIATARDIIGLAGDAARKKTKHVNNGYHSYLIEYQEWENNSETSQVLRSLLDQHVDQKRQKEQEQQKTLNELRSADIPGFFPTPKRVIDVMLEEIGPLEYMKVLEPSCGKGDLIAECVKQIAKSVTALEVHPKLARYCQDTLENKEGTTVEVFQQDFMEWTGNGVIVNNFDKILMNPPFEREQAQRHVKHALQFLRSDGRLVAVMPKGWDDKKTGHELLDAIEEDNRKYHTVDIESGSFAGRDAFNQTGVSVELLVVY